MCVGFVTAADLAVVRLVTGMDVRVFLPVTTVGEFSVTAVELALKWFLSFWINEKYIQSLSGAVMLLSSNSPFIGYIHFLTHT